MMNIDLPQTLSNRLELLSLTTGRTMQFYIREALLEYLDEFEVRYSLDTGSTDEPVDTMVEEEILEFEPDELFLD